MLKKSELNKSDKEQEYKESLNEKLAVFRGCDVESVEKDWKSSEILG